MSKILAIWQFAIILFVVVESILKLCGITTWSWIWVFSPIWISLIMWVILIIGALCLFKAIFSE
jgi:hypothetical protein